MSQCRLKALVSFLFIFAFGMLTAQANHAEDGNSLVNNAWIAKKMSRKYYTFNYPSSIPGGDTTLTGIRQTKRNPKKFYLSGFYTCPGSTCVVPFVYKGRLSGKGKLYILNYPSSPGKTVSETYLYGPNNGVKSSIQVVGNYTTLETGLSTIGCLYQGPLDGSGIWTTLIPTSSDPVLDTMAHSTMGGLVVGNYNTDPNINKAFIYDIKKGIYFDIVKPGAQTITASGIWHNGGNSYTICGGYSNENGSSGIGSAYLVDWNNKHRKFSNWRSYNYKNDPIKSLSTHFGGISSDGHGGYYLTGDWIGVLDGPELGFFCHIGKRKKAKWSRISFPHHKITSGNSVAQKIVIGVYTSPNDNTDNGFISIP